MKNINDEAPTQEQVTTYKMQEGDGVLMKDDMGDDTRVVRANMLYHSVLEGNPVDVIQDTRSFIRHDRQKFAEAIVKLL